MAEMQEKLAKGILPAEDDATPDDFPHLMGQVSAVRESSFLFSCTVANFSRSFYWHRNRW